MTDDGTGDRSVAEADAPGESRVFESAQARWLGLAALGVVVALLIGGSLGLQLFAPGVLDPAWLETRLVAFGPWAPVAFVGLQAAQVILAPVPGQLLAGVGGYLFGPVRGAAYSLVGVVVGSIVVFGGARRYGRPFVTWVVTDGTLARFDAFVDRYGAAGLFGAFLLPTFPDDALCLIAGLSPIRPRTFLLLLVVGRAPTFVAAAYAGAGVADGDYRLTLGLLGGLVALTVVVTLVRRYTDGTRGQADG